MRSRERCLRCGGPVADGVAICHRCNPASLPSPSRTQYHATVFLVMIVTLVLAAGAIYWDFVDVVWLCLFTTFYLLTPR